MKSRISAYLRLGLIGFCALVCTSTTAAPGDSWVRYLVPLGRGPADWPGVPFVIANTLRDPELSAVGWYRFIQNRDPVTLRGKIEGDNLFRPVVRYEVATKNKEKWKKISFESEQPTLDHVTIGPDSPVVRVLIGMEPFGRWIGTYRYGRVVLENGDAAVVDLEDLLPTASARDGHGNFKEDVTGKDLHMRKEGYNEPDPNAPADLSSVTSLGGKFTGDFIFEARFNKVRLDGKTTVDGDFWPTTTLYVGDCEKGWKKIGKSESSGTPSVLEVPAREARTIRISLTKYRPFIGRKKCGKVVFSNGQSAAFYVALLDPQG